MKCEECGNDTDGTVCKNCGLVIDDRPIAQGMTPRAFVDRPITGHDAWEHPLIPPIRKRSRAFNLKYQDEDFGHIYIKAFKTIGKIHTQLKLPKSIKLEALNLFKNIRRLDSNFFRKYQFGPTCLACIKIACKIRDFPISNIELYEAIDYIIRERGRQVVRPELKDGIYVKKERKGKKHTRGHMERKFNNAYRAILKLYKIYLKMPEHPNFINFACNRLNLPYKFEKKIHEKHTLLKKYFQPHFMLEGYILALIYIFGAETFDIKIIKLSKIFHISTATISNRKNEVLKYASKEM